MPAQSFGLDVTAAAGTFGRSLSFAGVKYHGGSGAVSMGHEERPQAMEEEKGFAGVGVVARRKCWRQGFGRWGRTIPFKRSGVIAVVERVVVLSGAFEGFQYSKP